MLLVVELLDDGDHRGDSDGSPGGPARGRSRHPASREDLGRRAVHVRRGSARWRALVLAALLAGLALVTVPVFLLGPYEGRLVTRFVALAVALIGLQFVLGRAGMLSLCHGAFVGLGAYATSLAASRWGWPIAVGVILAPVSGFGAGCLVGLLALRIRATYLGPVTLAVAVAFPMVVKRFAWLTGGSSGLPLDAVLQPPPWLWLPAGRPYLWTHLVVLAIALPALLAAHNLARSPVGLAVRAVATGPTPATASGVPVRRYRVLAFGVGAAFGGLGGGLLVLDTPIVGADSYDLARSLSYYAAVVVGGTAALAGPVLGAALLTAVPWLLSTYGLRMSQNLVFGGLLLLVTFAAPGGLAAAAQGRLATVLVIDEVPPRPPPPRPLRRRRGVAPRRPGH